MSSYRGICAFVVCLLFAIWNSTLPAAESAKAAPSAQELEQSLIATMTNLHATMKSGTKEEKRKALQSLMPTKEDVQLLFPQQAEQLWDSFSKQFATILSRIDEVSQEFNRFEVTEYLPSDLRKQAGDAKLQNAISLLPADVPVYQIEASGANHKSVSESYLFVRGRWILIRRLGSIFKSQGSGHP